MLCDVEAEQNPYHPSQLSRFKKRVGARRLQRIMGKLLMELLKGGVINDETVVLDATFIKAYSRRDPHENSRGKSDLEARVGRNGRTYELGYKLHIASDAKSELPLAVIAAPPNRNEKKHASALFRKAMKAAGQRMKTLVADSQYSSRKLRTAFSSQREDSDSLPLKPGQRKEDAAAGGQVLQDSRSRMRTPDLHSEGSH